MSRRQRHTTCRAQALAFSSSESESVSDSESDTECDTAPGPEPDALDACDDLFDDGEESECDPQVAFLHYKNSGVVCVNKFLITCSIQLCSYLLITDWKS